MDQLTDNNPADFKFLKSQLEEPEFAKEASTSTDDVAANESTSFALPSLRQLPLDTPANAYTSKVYFEANKGNYKDATTRMINRRLNKAARFFKIEGDFKQIEEATNTVVKTANVQTAHEYALSFEKDNTVYRFYPMSDAEDVRESATKLANDKSKMTLAWFQDASENLVKKANTFNIPMVELPKAIVEKGVSRELDTKHIKVALDQRIRYLNSVEQRTNSDFSEEKGIYKDMFIAALGDAGAIQKYASLIEDFDSMVGIDYKHVMDPIAAFYSGPETEYVKKMACSYLFIGDAMIPTEAFIGVPFEKLAREFSKETATKITELQKKASENQEMETSLFVEHGLKALDPTVQFELIGLVVNETE